jgi:hypothetical protein
VKKVAAALLLLFAAFCISAQEESDDFDDLFEGEVLEEEVEPAIEQGNQEDLFEEDLFEESAAQEGEAEEVAPEEAFLVSERLEWGGSFDLTFTTQVAWDGYPAPWGRVFWQEGVSSLTSKLAGDLFFDARPDRDFRVFGKVKAVYQYPADWDVEIFELFSDFQIKDLLFFRVGKQTVQWGVGYFFSPADVLNLVSIDVEDPEAEREGPIAVKTHLPFTAHNAYLYLVANDIDKPYEIAVAPKLELLLGNYELGLGAFYQTDLTPKGMLTLTGPLGDLDLFAEAMVQWGSDRTFVDFSPPPSTNTIEDELLFSGTAGFSYINSDWNISLFAQYFFNGQGYDEPYDYEILIEDSSDALPLPPEIPTPAIISSADLLYPGRHYLAASIAWSELLDSAFGLSLLYVANFSDRSGLINPILTWEPVDHVSLSTGFRFRYGQEGDEYGPNKYDPTAGPLAWTLSASLGGGRF